jgi:hypothetical protein
MMREVAEKDAADRKIYLSSPPVFISRKVG